MEKKRNLKISKELISLLTDEELDFYEALYHPGTKWNPLPVIDSIDVFAARTYFFLRRRWEEYQDPNTSEKDKKSYASQITKLHEATETRKRGQKRTSQKEIYYDAIKPFVEERLVMHFNYYKQVGTQEAKEKVIEVIFEFAQQLKETDWPIPSNLKSQLRNLNWKSLTAKGFATRVSNILVGYKPKSLTVMKSRRRKKLKS